MKKFLQQAHWLSIDVVIGAVASNLVFWKLPDGFGEINIVAPVVLGVAVFVVYAADRLFDLRKVSLSNTLRHQFHAKNKKILWEIVLTLGFFSMLFALTLPAAILKLGVILTIIVGLYLFAVNQLPENSFLLMAKEPLTAIIYSGAIFGSVFVTRSQISWQEWAIAFFMFLIAFQNLLLFSIYESVAKPASRNLASFLGKGTSRTIITITFLLIMVGGAYVFAHCHKEYLYRVLVIQMIMSSILWLLNDFIKFFIQHERYRWLGDGVFLLMLAAVY